jgi:hypothetical protein
MIQVIERRRVDRRLAERRRSPYKNEYATGIYRCDCCDYDASSRSDDINHHFNLLVHSIVRIFHQIIDYLMESLSADAVRSLLLPSSVALGAGNTGGKEKSRMQQSHATTFSPSFSFLKNIDWKECISESLYVASQALALVATFAGGIVFAATALMFAIFPGGSGSGDFHEAMEREYRRKLEAERKRREREEEELEREEKQQRRDDENALKIQEEMERMALHVRRDGFKHQSPNDKTSIHENDRRIKKLNYEADDVLNGKADINSFDKGLTEFRIYEEERTKKNEQEEKERRKKYEQYLRYLNARAEGLDLEKKSDSAHAAHEYQEAERLYEKARAILRESEEYYKRSL